MKQEGAMHRLLSLLGAAFMLFHLGCSCTSSVERENFTAPEARQEYITEHPAGSYNENIQEGEITRGMNVYEVIASWGLPNVYMLSKTGPEEYWVYYVEDEGVSAIIIYTLAFSDDILEDWEIDMKRFTGESTIVIDSGGITAPVVPGSSTKKAGSE
jgi:hypothetical protein